MDTKFIFELIGYVASVLIAISLMMSSVLRLRIINLVGSITFTVYGVLIGAYPVAIVNFLIVLIDLYYLVEMLRAKEFFTLLDVENDSQYLKRFLTFYKDEIEKFLPEFTYQKDKSTFGVFVLRNLVPAGLFLGQVEDDILHVNLDFVIPGYRDFKVGKYLFANPSDVFTSRSICRICSRPGNQAHAAYLQRMGFSLNIESGLYSLDLK